MLRYQQVSVFKVQSLRDNIKAMAHTLIELLTEDDYDQQTKKECQDELQDIQGPSIQLELEAFSSPAPEAAV